MSEGAALFAAIAAGDEAAVDRLVSQSPELASARDTAGCSAVRAARYRGLEEAVARLLAAQPALDVSDAAAVGDVTRLRELLDDDPERVRWRSEDGFTPLHLAAFFGSAAAVATLLEAGADPCAVADNATHVQPLHSAVAGRCEPAARLLLEAGAEADARQLGGWTPLHAAAQHGDTSIVGLLVEHGAAPETANDEGRTARDLAAEHGHAEVAALLG